MSELIVSLATLMLACVLLNPMKILMPDAITMTIIALFFICFAVFAFFVWRERALDERDELHRMRAGHNAYLAVSGVLVLAIGIQSFSHNVDPWLVIAFAVSVLTKAVASFWNKKNN